MAWELNHGIISDWSEFVDKLRVFNERSAR